MNEVSNYTNLFLLIIGKIRLIRCFLSTPMFVKSNFKFNF
mgnify:CR=1 FL=1